MKFNVKYIRSLHQQKNRKIYKQFIAEGVKCVEDIISTGHKPELLLFDTSRADEVSDKIKQYGEGVNNKTIERVSNMKTAPAVFAVFNNFYNQYEAISDNYINSLLKNNILYLDNISDPGNLGTIIRTADWFGFRNLVCSENTVELYNPKVVQATMGAIANVKLRYVNANIFFSICKEKKIDVCGLDMSGKDIRKLNTNKKAIYVIGNEANGISDTVKHFLTDRVSIFPHNNVSTPKLSESLNAAISCAILCYVLA